MSEALGKESLSSWEEFTEILSEFKDRVPTPTQMKSDEFFRLAGRGTAFITFDYGIDGVSIEISKYAQALESLFGIWGDAKIHFIGGDFYRQADSVLRPDPAVDSVSRRPVLLREPREPL